MSKKKLGKTRHQLREEDEGVPQLAAISREDYEAELHLLQIEFVKLQRHVIRKGSQILVLLEGRDAAGKDGSIKRIVEHLSPRDTRVVALGKPSDRDQRRWYFRRFVSQLPEAGEVVLFNRSWYNRAGVERVMGFCSAKECEQFLQLAPQFEGLLVNSGIVLLKYYLDISKGDQKQRLRDRSRDPLKQWKTSAIDEVAIKHWDAYCTARDEMRAAHAHRGRALAHHPCRQQTAGPPEPDAPRPFPAELCGQEADPDPPGSGDRLRVRPGLPGIGPARVLSRAPRPHW